MVRLFTAIQLPETQKEVLLSMMGGEAGFAVEVSCGFIRK